MSEKINEKKTSARKDSVSGKHQRGGSANNKPARDGGANNKPARKNSVKGNPARKNSVSKPQHKNSAKGNPARDASKLKRDASNTQRDANNPAHDAAINKPHKPRKSSYRKHKEVSPGRLAALQVCRAVRERNAFAQDLIAVNIDSSPMSKQDRAFATKLVLGQISAQGTLDEIIDRGLNSSHDIKDDVRDALRISIYEMYFLDKSPHAAVDEGVELVRTFAPQATGVANVALRRASQARSSFPFGNPQTNLEAFARAYAFPVWLTRRLIADLGIDAARAFMEASNEPAPVYVSVCAARATDAEIYEELVRAKGEPQNIGVPGCFKLSSGRVLQDGRIRHLIENGKLFVSDASAQKVANLILPDVAPKSFLEIGAGRGTKTLLIQSHAKRKYGHQIKDYITLDNHDYKTKLLAERTKTYGINLAKPCTGDALKLSETFKDKTFDEIFIDAPCSGLGTLRRHPEIRWRLKEESINEMVQTSLSMLKQAAAHVSAAGTLALATCTVTHAENNAVVKAFLESDEGAQFSLLPMEGKGCFAPQLTLGGQDAHFAVKMKRAS